jgi:hypothetical protein
MGRIAVQLGESQRLAFPIEFRLLESLRSAAEEVRFLCLCVRSV